MSRIISGASVNSNVQSEEKKDSIFRKDLVSAFFLIVSALIAAAALWFRRHSVRYI